MSMCLSVHLLGFHFTPPEQGMNASNTFRCIKQSRRTFCGLSIFVYRVPRYQVGCINIPAIIACFMLSDNRAEVLVPFHFRYVTTQVRYLERLRTVHSMSSSFYPSQKRKRGRIDSCECMLHTICCGITCYVTINTGWW